MQTLHDGQCGLCSHFAEGHADSSNIVELRRKSQGVETLVDTCGHPRHASLHLKVTPISGCDGFEPAAMHA